MPEVFRNFWKSASLGKDCLRAFSKSAAAVLSEALTPWLSDSPSTHFWRMRNCMTWSRRLSYSCLHWVRSWVSVVCGWPLAGVGAGFRLLATHSTKLGGVLGALGEARR